MIFWKKKADEFLDINNNSKYPIIAIPGDKVRITIIRTIEINEHKTFNNLEEIMHYWKVCS